MVVLRSKNEIEGLRRAGDLVARALVLLRSHVRAGVRLDELDRIVEAFIHSEGGEPAYKGYRPSLSVPPFPSTICTAVNEEVVHGIPGPRRLRAGDIVGIDVGATLGGWVGDTCYTYPVGDVSPRAGKLLDVTRECLEAGIAEICTCMRTTSGFVRRASSTAPSSRCPSVLRPRYRRSRPRRSRCLP